MWHRIWGLLSGLIFIISLFSKDVFIGNCYGSDLEGEADGVRTQVDGIRERQINWGRVKKRK